MATAVKMDEDAKARLEELQAEIRLKTGQSVTQQEVLARLVEAAYESKSEFVASFREQTVPVSDDDRAAFHDGQVSSGVETTEADIDDVLYE